MATTGPCTVMSPLEDGGVAGKHAYNTTLGGGRVGRLSFHIHEEPETQPHHTALHV